MRSVLMAHQYAVPRGERIIIDEMLNGDTKDKGMQLFISGFGL